MLYTYDRSGAGDCQSCRGGHNVNLSIVTEFCRLRDDDGCVGNGWCDDCDQLRNGNMCKERGNEDTEVLHVELFSLVILV